MSTTTVTFFLTFLGLSRIVAAQQQCYFGPGAANRGPAELVPCKSDGESACCLLGDTCLSGGACYNYATGDLYQYGCTDVTYSSDVCPYKCGFNSTLSPWTALEYCNGVDGVDDTWVCHAPESCACEWKASTDLLVLQPRGCKEMGSDARVALYAPSTLAPYVSLPSTYGGETSYYSGTTINGTSTWISTALSGYTPATVTELTTYGSQPRSAVVVEPNATPGTSAYAAPIPSSATPTASTASATSSGPTSSAASSSSSSVTPPAQTSLAASTSSGLSTGAKAGIGVGAAGAFCLAAAIAIAFFMWGRSGRKRKAASSQHQEAAGGQYPFPPEQKPPYYPLPGSPPPAWHPGAYLMQMQQPHPYDVRTMHSPVPTSPVAMKQMPSPPMELSAEQVAPHEMETLPARNTGTPSPEYSRVNTPKP